MLIPTRIAEGVTRSETALPAAGTVEGRVTGSSAETSDHREILFRPVTGEEMAPEYCLLAG